MEEQEHITQKYKGGARKVMGDVFCSNCSMFVISMAYFCSECSLGTNDIFCLNCVVECCSSLKCNAVMCKRCFEQTSDVSCILCVGFICSEHSDENKCAYCEDILCTRCSLQCELCESKVCENSTCVQTCVICDKEKCKTCFVTCVKCKKEICLDCIGDELSGAVFCTKCITSKSCKCCQKDDMMTRICGCGQQVCSKCSVVAFDKTRCRDCM